MTNIAMLSCGHVHTKGYCEAIAKRDDCRLAAVWDDMAERGRKFAADHGAEFNDDLTAAIAREDVDGFIICAENTRHLPLLRAAVPAGKPVFCEKPFTTTVADAAEAMALIRRHGTTVFMGYFQPFSAEMQGVATLLADGALGTVEASWVQTGGMRGLEITGSQATLFQHTTLGHVCAAPREEPKPVEPGEAKPTQVARLVAAIEGSLSAQELAEDLAAAADAVAIMEACYESSETGGWVEVPRVQDVE